MLVGNKDDVRRAAQLFATHPEHGVRPVASVTPSGVPTVLPNGPIRDLTKIVGEHRAEHVLVVSSELGDDVMEQFGRARPDGVRLSLLPPMAEIMTAGARVVDVRGLPFLSLAPRRRAAGRRGSQSAPSTWWAPRSCCSQCSRSL